MPQISVIVPVYKVEPYLHRCIDSVLNQTFTDFELILVDDGSPDNCGAICDEYAAKDPRVRVIHKENGGLSSARNAGIDIARGDYLSFVDSDDYVHPCFLEVLLYACNSSNSGYAACAVTNTRERNCEYRCFPELQKQQYECVDSNTVLERYNKEFYPTLHAYVCNKIYKKYCFDQFRFNEKMQLYEDEYICLELIERAEKVAITKLPLYFYYQSEGSLMRSELNEKDLFTFVSLQHMSDFMKSRNLLVEHDIFEYKWFLAYLNIYYRMKTEKPGLLDKLLIYEVTLREKMVSLLKNGQIPRAFKLVLLLFAVHPLVAKPLYVYLMS